MKLTSAMTQLLEKLNQNKNGRGTGVYSICSANKHVLCAGMEKALSENSFLLIEATCNQVNQFGGYTGMKPIDFVEYVNSIAEETSFPVERIILGGDHLGPYPWRGIPAETALINSEQLVREYGLAGFQKIHIDASMYCVDDDFSKPLNKELSAERVARLCKVVESEISLNKLLHDPVYVIGTEVPVPGGQLNIEDGLSVTSVEEIKETLAIFEKAFREEGLESAWSRVVAVVVQPGVEFSENGIIEYKPENSVSLKSFIETIPRIVYEAHSTDYQTQAKLKKMVEDHFAILKVGPALTFAFREAVFGLQQIENQLLRSKKGNDKSDLIKIISKVMEENPDDWKNYIQQGEDVNIAKIFSYSDRIRYYWNFPQVEVALQKLFMNLRNVIIPLTLISQYLPRQYEHIREGRVKNEPSQLINDHIIEVLDIYANACKQ
jgi:D-tagatose-1,6-bisphosphate aldolase subunit GatZ/KbaZ